MSISLPNGTLLAAPSSTTTQYTAAVTRILHLANFSKELKTRDLQAIFRDYETEKGGFRIKWLDDVNALVVFNDAGIAKRAYLHLLLHPPPHFAGLIKPYDRPDAAQIIQSLAARSLGHRGSSSHAAPSGFLSTSISMPPPPLPEPPQPPHPSHVRTSSAASAFGSFALPKSRGSISGLPNARNPNPNPTLNGTGTGMGFSNGTASGLPTHTRAGSASSYSRQPLAGVLNFNLPSTQAGRMPTHSESSAPTPSRSASSSDTEPIVVLDSAPYGSWKGGMGMGKGESGGIASGFANGYGHGHGSSNGPARRDSLSAEKAMKEVEKALASVEAQG